MARFPAVTIYYNEEMVSVNIIDGSGDQQPMRPTEIKRRAIPTRYVYHFRREIVYPRKIGVVLVENAVVSLVLPVLFGLGSLLMAALAFASFQKKRRWRTEGVTVEGEVVDFLKRDLPVRENLDERDDRVQKYSPILSFNVVGDKAYRVTASAMEPEGAYSLGQRLPVRYLASSPEMADLEKMTLSNVPTVAFSILSLIAGTAAFLIFTAARGD
jgi:hypothetical protein